MKYGIMQGRLTPSNGRGIQFFPFDNWKQEFYDGQSLGIDEIEWIFDFDSYEDNPLWSKSGIDDINNVIKESSVEINSVCFDYYMRRAYYKWPENNDLLEENISIGRRVIENMSKIGASLIEIPVIDGSKVTTPKEREQASLYIEKLKGFAKDHGIRVALETDFAPDKFRGFLDDIEDVYANYDSGNSSGLGYDHREELISLNELVANVHIKDRILGGTTVKLGTGSADFESVFSSLKDIDYKGSIILQAARSKDGTEKNNIKSQLEFVKDYVKKYGLE